jgi:hypothetical protein
VYSGVFTGPRCDSSLWTDSALRSKPQLTLAQCRPSLHHVLTLLTSLSAACIGASALFCGSAVPFLVAVRTPSPRDSAQHLATPLTDFRKWRLPTTLGAAVLHAAL